MANMYRETALGRLAQIQGMLDEIQEKCLEVKGSEMCMDCILQMKAYNHMLRMRLQKVKSPKQRKYEKGLKPPTDYNPDDGS